MLENLSERQMLLVSDLDALTMRMGRLNRDLLLLAKIDNAQYAATEEVDVVAMLSDSRSLYDALLNGTSLRVDDKRTSPHITVRANAPLLECLLKNLIVNAIRHSASGSDVRVVVGDESLTVCNIAAADKPLDRETLFRRFHTGDVWKKGNGLGLAIVKAICDLHHWAVDYRFETEEHRFSVCFQPECHLK